MYYYSSNIPKVGQVILGHLINEKEGENCMYVRIPEYNNIEGMIPKSNLPKKRRAFNKVLAQMRKEIIVPCVLKTKPQINDDGTPWMLDLTLKNIDRESKQVFINRFNNIARILKVIKFLSEETEVDFRELCTGIWEAEILELFADRIVYGNKSTSDEDEGSDSDEDNKSEESSSDVDSEQSDSPQQLTDLSDVYQKVVGNQNYLIDMIRRGMELSPELEQSLRDVIASHSEAKKSDCSIQFEFRVDNADDPVQVLQDTFTKVLDANPDITIHYKGAPIYMAIKPNVGPADLGDVIDGLREAFEEFLRDESCKYHLKFSIETAEAKEPTYSFSFPRLIEI